MKISILLSCNHNNRKDQYRYKAKRGELYIDNLDGFGFYLSKEGCINKITIHIQCQLVTLYVMGW